MLTSGINWRQCGEDPGNIGTRLAQNTGSGPLLKSGTAYSPKENWCGRGDSAGRVLAGVVEHRPASRFWPAFRPFPIPECCPLPCGAAEFVSSWLAVEERRP